MLKNPIDKASYRYSILSICVNFTVFSFVMAYNIKKFVPCLNVILLLVSKTSTFNSPNSQYLKIFGFIRIDFMCFSNMQQWIRGTITITITIRILITLKQCYYGNNHTYKNKPSYNNNPDYNNKRNNLKFYRSILKT